MIATPFSRHRHQLALGGAAENLDTSRLCFAIGWFRYLSLRLQQPPSPARPPLLSTSVFAPGAQLIRSVIMRLINIQTLQLEEFMGRTPPYAILSHTWGAEEVTFQEFHHPGIRQKKSGFNKIALTCTQAKRDGLKYAWVDTCCIDKTKSAELAEAINSMFKWYKDSAICYAFLPDVPGTDEINATESKFPRSRWFTRGWTLQELIAPRRMLFYGMGWKLLGKKDELGLVLQHITGISPKILSGGDLMSVSVAERMSWAARRQTTREEDIAYCLMGIFDVNMPMMYGEGGPASFLRLQQLIMKDLDDHSLFAWQASTSSAKDAPYRGLLADSPAEFAVSPAEFAVLPCRRDGRRGGEGFADGRFKLNWSYSLVRRRARTWPAPARPSSSPASAPASAGRSPSGR